MIREKRHVYLRRLIQYGINDEECVCYRDEYVPRDEAPPVRIHMGEIDRTAAWWELPLPPCPDCGAEITWAEAGLVPGARACQPFARGPDEPTEPGPFCGSLFKVETASEEDWRILQQIDP